MAIEDLKEPKPAAAPAVADAKQALVPAQQNPGPGYQGLILLDWDHTVVNENDRFINFWKTRIYLRAAFKNKVDIRIVTGRPNIQDVFDSLFEKLKRLNLVDETHNEAFWREHIHCVVKDLNELASLNKIPNSVILAKRKKECIESILAKPEYLHLQKNQIYFYDDNLIICNAVGEIGKVTIVQAKANGSHLDIVLPGFEQHMQEQPLHDYFTLLNACLNAMYPNRAQWGDDPNISSGGVKELHRVLKLLTEPKDFTLDNMMKIYNIATRRLQKTCIECLPTFFGGRDPFLQQLYSALDYYPRLDSLGYPIGELDGLLARIKARNAQQNAAPAAQIALAVR